MFRFLKIASLQAIILAISFYYSIDNVMKNDLDDIVKRLNEGDKKAYGMLFLMYADKLYKFSRSFYADDRDAEEIVQEVFMKLWINRKGIKDPGTFNAYIFTIAKNLIYNNLKRRVYSKKYYSYLKNAHSYHANLVEESFNFNELENAVRRVIEGFPAKRKEIFLLSRNEGLSNKEIAQRLNLSLRTVETHIYLALKHIKKTLDIR